MIRVFVFLLILTGCQSKDDPKARVITADIDRFWTMFDVVSKRTDSLEQLRLLEEMYLSQGTSGLKGIIDAKRYSSDEFLNMINQYPKFLQSIKSNTYKARELSSQLEEGIEKLKTVYPELKPAKIYFTIGAMRSGGTTIDSLVLIGSELAMVDEHTDISEFEGRMKTWAVNYIETKPLDNIVLLNVHEYVHTQQKPIPDNLLYQCLYEGVAEFISTKAMGVPSSSPAVKYGKSNPKVKEVFENEMFYDLTYKWLWSNAPNQFDVRDLGYYIGYQLCELHYEKETDKKKAIKELIEINYEDTRSVDSLIDNTNFFSKPINLLRTEDKKRRPKIVRIKEFENGSLEVDPMLEEITIEFSQPLNGYNTGVNYGELGEDAFPKIVDRMWSEDSKSWTMKVELEPDKKYEILITNNFRTEKDIPLVPFLIQFTTGSKGL